VSNQERSQFDKNSPTTADELLHLIGEAISEDVQAYDKPPPCFRGPPTIKVTRGGTDFLVTVKEVRSRKEDA